jgi:hypothetical protein
LVIQRFMPTNPGWRICGWHPSRVNTGGGVH